MKDEVGNPLVLNGKTDFAKTFNLYSLNKNADDYQFT